RLRDAARDWDGALDLRRRALAIIESGRELSADVVGEVDRAVLYMEIGEIEENRRRDDDAALAAYEAAFGARATMVQALHAQARILRRQRRFDLVLDVLRAELALKPDKERELQIQLDIAGLTSGGAAGD